MNGQQPGAAGTEEVEIEISPALRDVLAERHRLGGDAAAYSAGALGMASVCYAHYASTAIAYQAANRVPLDRLTYKLQQMPPLWPWPASDLGAGRKWEPVNPRRDLIRAAAMLLGEIEKLDEALAASMPAPAGPAPGETTH